MKSPDKEPCANTQKEEVINDTASSIFFILDKTVLKFVPKLQQLLILARF
jgi:hypothetical protein